jgi:predicted dehydrogenase
MFQSTGVQNTIERDAGGVHLIAKAAADHRGHMLIEVPLAFTRAMMDLIEEAAAKAGVHMEVGKTMAADP